MKRKTFIWTEVLQNYTYGLAVARAYDKQHAIRKLCEQFRFLYRKDQIRKQHNKMEKKANLTWPPVEREDRKRQKLQNWYDEQTTLWHQERKKRIKSQIPFCDMGTCYDYTIESFRKELEEKDPLVISDGCSFGVFVGGGS